MQKILIITALLAFASFSLAQTLTPTVQLVVTYPNGHLQFQYGDSVTYTTSVAQVGNGTSSVPSGSVIVKADGNTRATCNLLNNPSTNIVCSVNDTMGPLAAGPHNFTSSYSGDANYKATDSDISTIRVFAQASLTLVASPTNPTPSQAIVITVTTSLNPSGQPAPTGNITFTQNGNNIGSCNVTSPGGCTFTIPANTFSQGTVTVVGQYTGDQTYAPSSGSVTIVVGPAAGTTTTTSTTNVGTTTTTTNANTGVNTNAGSTTTTNAGTTTNTNAGTTTNTNGETDGNTNAGTTTNTNTGANTGATLNTGAAAVTGQSSTAFTGTTGSAASVCGSLLVTILAAAMVL